VKILRAWNKSAAGKERASRNRALWSGEAVEARGIVRPLPIAEIDGAICKGAGFQRNPIRIGQIRVRLDDEGDVRGADNVKPELIRLYAKTGAAGFCLWIPQHRRGQSAVCIEGLPAGGFGKVIDGAAIPREYG
jgi:hypothetical protein